MGTGPAACVCARMSMHAHWRVCTHEHAVAGGGVGQGARWPGQAGVLCSQAPPEPLSTPSALDEASGCAPLLRTEDAAPVPSCPGQHLRGSPSALCPRPGKCLRPREQHSPPSGLQVPAGAAPAQCARAGQPLCLSIAQKAYLKKRRGHLRWDPPPPGRPHQRAPDKAKQKKCKVKFKWQRGSREASRVLPGVGGRLVKGKPLHLEGSGDMSKAASERVQA